MYGYQHVVNLTTGEISAVEVTADWLLAYRPEQLALQADKASLQADGQDAVVISVQLQTPLGDALQQARVVELILDDNGTEVTQPVELDGTGAGALTLHAVLPGTITVRAAGLPSNVEEVTAL